MTVLCVLLAAAAVILLAAFLCFLLVFYAPTRKPIGPEEYPIPRGKIYEPHRDLMIEWMKATRQLPYEEWTIQSFDGLTLRGKYYEYAPGAPVELMLHGYRGSAERDMAGGVMRAFALGRSALVVEQRAGGSDGHVISFGIHESRDCRDWAALLVERLGPDTNIILTGISMGASTVLMAAGEDLPSNVIGVLADCGYTSGPAIIKKCIRELHLPVWPLYPLIRLGGRLFGGFDIEDSQPIEAVQRARVPVLFIHGEDDAFVPCLMSRENYAACVSRKALWTVPGAGHGLCYPADPQGYLQALREFEPHWGIVPTKR